MANTEHLEILKNGIDYWNKWRAENPAIKPDLSFAIISDPYPKWAYGEPVYANLSGIDFSNTNLTKTILKRATLNGANLKSAELRGADLRKSTLRNANLAWANLHQTNFTLANLSRADLTKALFWETIIDRTILRNAIGLLESRHGGPSVFTYRSLARSKGIPREFISNCNIPDEIITAFYDYVEKNPEPPSVFISYSTKNSDIANKLYGDLTKNKIDCFLAEHSLKGGKTILEQIEDAIEDYDRAIIILSQDSMASSWVSTEISKIRDIEKSKAKNIFFPIRLVEFEAIKSWKIFNSDTGEDLGKIIREYYIPDFSDWAIEEQYQMALGKLLEDLQY